MDEDMEFRELFSKLISVYKISPEAAEIMLQKILEILSSGADVPYLGFEEE